MNTVLWGILAYLARAGVATFGIVAYVIALHAEGVFALVEEASSFGSSGIFIVVTLGLFTRWGGALAATASLLAGVTAWIAGAYIADLAFPYLISLLAAFAAYSFVALGTQRHHRARIFSRRQ